MALQLDDWERVQQERWTMPRFPFLNGARQRWLLAAVLLLGILWITAFSYVHHTRPAFGSTEPMKAEDLSQSIPPHPWAPYSLTSCIPNAPAQFAPCKAASLQHCILAEELVYPDFEFQMPYFAKEEHRERFMRLVKSELGGRAALVDGESTIRYAGQHGQNYVSFLKNPSSLLLGIRKCGIRARGAV